jgi:hypothetical protein
MGHRLPLEAGKENDIDKGGGWRDNKGELICCGDDCPLVTSDEGGNSAEI